jgi:2-polyprenyl-3-methyl-5-hydroxy-6-metoxy-1,4-benzoquinol methylase
MAMQNNLGNIDQNQNAVWIFNKNAELYQTKFMDVGLYHNTFDIFFDALPPGAEVLELACGPGNISKYLLEKRPDLRLFGTDLAPNMVTLAQQNNPTATFGVLDCREIDTLIVSYDGIMCGFALPYLTEPECRDLIANASKLLRSGGILYLSTMEENEFDSSGMKTGSTGESIYMHYHREENLVKALTENDFNIIVIDRKITANDDGSHVTDLIVIARKLP